LGEHDDLFQKGGFFSSANPRKLQIPLSLFDSEMISSIFAQDTPTIALAW
jgi:hypothetical protein